MMSPERPWRGLDPTRFSLYQRVRWRLDGPLSKGNRWFQATDWRLKLDPENVGLTDGWGERGLPGETVAAEVPGVWNTIYPGYAGVAWYEAVFTPDRRLRFHGMIRLAIGAANYLTDAWMNGVYLGRHEGGYEAFSFRCADLVERGTNRVTLRIVDPPLDGEIDGLNLRTTPTAKESWYGGAGGPWGGVWLEDTPYYARGAPHAWIEDVQTRADLATRRATFTVTVASNLPEPASVDIAAGVEMDGCIVTIAVPPTGATATLCVDVPSSRPWSPESPWLHPWTAGLRLTGDRWTDVADGHLGFRTVEWRDGAFYLNGERRFLKGALLQPTVPRTIIGPARDYGDRDIGLARNAGINLLRCHLRPPPYRFLDRCDAAGMMTYVEPPLAWIEPSGRLLEHGKRELAAMVRACGNHPSVVMWGIFNENARATDAVGGELLAELARLDPTRPIIENSGGAAVGEVGMWAWGGQSRCWSPGWDAPRPLNDVHIYLANPLRREARELMATVGDGPTLDVTPGRPAEERIESRLSADAVIVSEYGCGALPDFEAALAAFGAETHLADAVLLRDLRDDLARGLAERGLDREIGDVPSLVEQTQALQTEGIVAQTAALRSNPNVSGLILTQLADAGWEQMAGLVGLWRHPRPALEAFRRALAPRLLHVSADDPCGTTTVTVRPVLIQEPVAERRRYRDGTLTIQVGNDAASAIGYTVAVGGDPGSDTFTTTARLPDAPGRHQIQVRLNVPALNLDETAACTVLRLPDRPATTGAGVVLLGHELRRTLPDALADVPSDWTGPILAHLPSDPSQTKLARAVERARAGAHLCLVGLEPASAKRLEAPIGIALPIHGARGNFMGMHHYLREHPIFDGLGAPRLADSVFAEMLPAWALEELPGADVLAGCFTVPDGGRAFLWRASVQTVPFGQGRLTLWQLALGQRQGGALGRYLLDRLVEWCASASGKATSTGVCNESGRNELRPYVADP